MRRLKTLRLAVAAFALLAVLMPAERAFAAGSPEAPAWMKVDATAKSVSFEIKMAENGSNGTFNFNGYSRGALSVIVPLGWRVRMHVINVGEGAIPHSLEIAGVTTTMPAQGVDPAFAQAYTVQLVPGMGVGQTDDVDFTADKAGKYWMLCGVPGHAAGGMWDWFIVSETAKVPTITISKGE